VALCWVSIYDKFQRHWVRWWCWVRPGTGFPEFHEFLMNSSSEVKWKGPFRFLPSGIFGITSGGCSLISLGPVRPKFAVPFLTNWFTALLLFTYVGNSEKKWKLARVRFLLVGPVWSENVVPCNKYRLKALCPFLDFLAEIFPGSQKETRGSWLEARACRLAK